MSADTTALMIALGVAAAVTITIAWYYDGYQQMATTLEPLMLDDPATDRLIAAIRDADLDALDHDPNWRLFPAPEFTDYLPTIYDDLIVTEAMAELDIELPSVLDGKWGAA